MYPITLDGDSLDVKRGQIKQYFLNSNELFEKVFELLRDESVFYKKSEPTRHPMIFYYGHTAAFFINKLVTMKVITQRINPYFESLFAVGVDEMDWDKYESLPQQWPSVAEVKEYRNAVQKCVLNLIESIDFTLPIHKDCAMWIILMGIEHERIHIETSLVLHRQMPIEDIVTVDDFVLCDKIATPAPVNELVQIEGGVLHLGKTDKHHLYGWDNEYGVYTQNLQNFYAAKYLVSNGEFMEFVADGAYEKEEYWTQEGLAFLQKSGAKHPPFWLEDKEKKYRYRALYEIVDMPLSWPVEVNAHEAEAFCRYKSKKENKEYRLPTEAEYGAIYKYSGLSDVPNFDEKSANINFSHYASSTPVDMFEHGGLYDVVGNVWQWSATPIRAFKGFDVHPAYDDFSTPTFDENHALIFGGSWASSGNLMMQHSRYAFRRHFFQNAGFRYVVSDNKEQKEDVYESDALVAQYCEFQYASQKYFGVENFACKCAQKAVSLSIQRGKALDLGCATGRASFELAKYFDKVEGIDFSARFISVGSHLKKEGSFSYATVKEGEIYQKKEIFLHELGYEDIAHKVDFWQGDACNLREEFCAYDLIMATNLIDRLYNPQLFLEGIKPRLNKGGILILTSPYTWQEESTPKELWLGGYYDANAKEVCTFEKLFELLCSDFELICREDMEFVIQETARKYQHSIAEFSAWRKK
jgi:5-histidylcysteine sulfoxide synthase/putative 4-mercaptohistidine N1-methyltranferase